MAATLPELTWYAKATGAPYSGAFVVVLPSHFLISG